MKAKLLMMFSLLLLCIYGCEKEIPEYRVNFSSNGGSSVSEQVVQEGGTIKRPADPTKTGAEFGGWYSDSGLTKEWDFDATVSNSMTLYARWISQYTVTFELNGGDGTAPPKQVINEKGKATKPTDPTRAGYRFDGWYDDANLWNFNTVVTKNVTLKAMWTEQLTVTFDSDNGDSVTTVDVYDGEKVSAIENPTRENYTFTGWFNGDTKWDFNDIISTSITLTAKWEENSYFMVNFDLAYTGAEPLDAQKVYENKTATEPTVPLREGYSFVGWFNGDSEWEFTTVVTAEITLTAKWLDQVIVSFDLGYADATETPQPQSFYGEGTVSEPNEPQRNGYKFVGWFNGEEKWEFTSTTSLSITLTAKWIEIYSVTFNLGYEGATNAPETILLEQEMAISEPTKPIRAGYRFDGWFYNNMLWEFATPISASIELMAKWTQEFEVTFDTNYEGGAKNVITGYLNEKLPPIKVDARAGYIFNGWYKDTQLTEEWNIDNDIVTSSMTLYAKWINENVTYDVNITYNDPSGNSTVPSIKQTVKVGNLITRPNDPSPVDGYRFMGWRSSLGGLWNFDTDVVLEGVSLSVAWELEYTIEFVSNGTITPVKVIAGENFDAPTVSFESYTLLGWYIDANFTNKVEFPTKYDGTERYYAMWDVPMFTVTVARVSETNLRDTTFTKLKVIENGTIGANLPQYPATLPNGLNFNGWYYLALNDYGDLGMGGTFDETTVITENITICPEFTSKITFTYEGDKVLDYSTSQQTYLLFEPHYEIPQDKAIEWYSNSEMTQLVTFPSEFVGITHYYGKLVDKGHIVAMSFYPSFNNSIYGDESYYEYAVAANGSKITAPTAPISYTHTLAGWYTTDSNNLWNFENNVLNVPLDEYGQANINFYAKWQPIANDSELFTYANSVASTLEAQHNYTVESWSTFMSAMEAALADIRLMDEITTTQLSSHKAAIDAAKDALVKIVLGGLAEIKLHTNTILDSEGNVVLVETSGKSYVNNYNYIYINGYDSNGNALLETLTGGDIITLDSSVQEFTHLWKGRAPDGYGEGEYALSTSIEVQIKAGAGKSGNIVVTKNGATLTIKTKTYDLAGVVTLVNSLVDALPSNSSLTINDYDAVNRYMEYVYGLQEMGHSSSELDNLISKLETKIDMVPFYETLTRAGNNYFIEDTKLTFVEDSVNKFPYGVYTSATGDTTTITKGSSGDSIELRVNDMGNTILAYTATVTLEKQSDDKYRMLIKIKE